MKLNAFTESSSKALIIYVNISKCLNIWKDLLRIFSLITFLRVILHVVHDDIIFPLVRSGVFPVLSTSQPAVNLGSGRLLVRDLFKQVALGLLKNSDLATG